jgi:hypothetical protein
MKNGSSLWVILLALLAMTARSQDYQRISITLTDAPFETFVQEVEQQSSFRFYYDPHWTDTLKVTVNASRLPIQALLNRVFASSTLFYTLHENSIFITTQRPILAELPVDFFNELPSGPSREELDYSEYMRRERQLRQAEEKLYTIGARTNDLKGNATITGTVRDRKTGEPLIGASVYIEEPMVGVATNAFGSYSITLRKGRHKLKIQSIGMKTTVRQIMLYANGKLDIEMEEDVTPLKEVIVEGERDARVMGMQMGTEKLDIRTMRNIPLALGETDIIKVMLTLPGVQSVGEGTSGFNVRGGATNQNLILYNDATVYNPAHLFGFFSTFNPDVLKNVELYKSGITADYGGRLSSVLDVRTREGNQKKISGSGGISPITGRLSLEGPIIKDKTSFLLGARSTYSDWILEQLDDPNLQNSTAAFYDLNANISHLIDEKNSLYLSGYKSRDKFRLNNDTLYQYSDRNASIKWRHAFSPQLESIFTGSYSQYTYEVSSEENPIEAARMNFRIRQWNAKADFSYTLKANQQLSFGASYIRYSLSPGNLQPIGSESQTLPDVIQDEQAHEIAAYVGDDFDITPRLSLYAGLRYSFYQNFGPREVYTYAPGVPKQVSTMTDTVSYDKGQPIQTYHGPEPRLSLRYTLPKFASVKFSYNRMHQYIQMLSNTTVIAPTDIWKLSDTYIRPQIGDQISIGYYKNLRNNTIETSVEAYYKTIRDATDFKDGAELLLNHHIETDVLLASGKAYGVEFFLKKTTGKLNGWLSYTYSRSLLQISGSTPAETVNNGKYYPSAYDKPHSVNFVGNYKFNRRVNFSLNVTYSTGRPITIPIARYELGGAERIYYSERNEFRIPDYFRTDASVNIEGNHKVRKLAHSSWTIALYNVTGRANPYSVYFTSENGEIKGYKLSIFAVPIPTITYNFKF